MDSIGTDIRPPLRLPASAPHGVTSSPSKEDDRCSSAELSQSEHTSTAFSDSYVTSSRENAGSSQPSAEQLPIYRNFSVPTQSSSAPAASSTPPETAPAPAASSTPAETASAPAASSAPAPEASSASAPASANASAEVANATSVSMSEIADEVAGDVVGVAETAIDAYVSTAETIGLSAAAGMVGGAVGFALVGVCSTILGGIGIHHGIKEHSKEQVLDGAGKAIGGVADNLAAASLAAQGSKTAFGAATGMLVAPLGVVAGVIDTGLSTKELVKGIKEKSKSKITSAILGLGAGIAVTASAVGGGIPALVATGVFLAAKIGYNIYAHHHAAQNAQQP